jgi:tRNA (guanine37-N1)-methyltransferase
MKLSFITLFPELVRAYFTQGLVSQSLKSNQFDVTIVNPRDFAQDKHKTVDDTPYGGGDGMLLKFEPLQKAVTQILPHGAKEGDGV